MIKETSQAIPDRAAEHRLNVFVSYSRHDLPRAMQIIKALEVRGLACTIDTRDLPYGEKWQRELVDFIKAADAVVFLVSSRSVRSTWCKWEVAQVAAQSKRLVPVVLEDVSIEELPPEIGEVHLLPLTPDLPFDERVDVLAATLLTDRDWIKEHTRLADRAARWLASQRRSDRLLSGGALREAETWRDRRPVSAPLVSQEILDFVLASRQVAARRGRFWLAGAISALVASILVGFWAWSQKLEADSQKADALIQRNQALSSQSKFLSSLSVQVASKGNSTLGTLISLEALPDSGAINPASRERPYVPAAERTLHASLQWLEPQTVLAQSGEAVTNATCDTSGSLAVISLAGGKVVLRRLDGEPNQIELVGHQASVKHIAVSADGRLVATSSEDKTARVWDAATGNAVAVLAGHTKAVEAGAFNRDGNRLATVSKDGTARQWDVHSGAQATAVDLVGRGEIAYAGILDFNEVAAVFKGTAGEIAYSARDDRVVDSLSNGNHAKIFNVLERADREIISPQDVRVGDSVRDIRSVSLADGGRRLLLLDGDGSAEVREAATRVVLAPMRGQRQKLESVNFDAAGTKVIGVSKEGTAYIWDAETGYLLWKLGGSGTPIQTVSSCGKTKVFLTSAANGAVVAWRPSSPPPAPRLPLPMAEVLQAQFNALGDRVATLSQSKELVFWDVSTRKAIARVADVNGSILKSLPDRRRDELATASVNEFDKTNDGTVRLWDGRTGRELSPLKGLKAGQIAAGLSIDGEQIATAIDDKIVIWDLRSARTLHTLENSAFTPTSLAFAPDGKTLALSWGYHSGPSGMYERAGGYEVWDIPSAKKVFSADLHEPVMGISMEAGTGQRLVALVRQKEGNLKRSKEADALVSSTEDKNLVAVFLGDTGRVIAYARSKIEVYDIETRERVAEADAQGEILDIWVAPKQDRLIALTAKGSMIEYPIHRSPKALIAMARAKLDRCLDLSERRSFALDPVPPRWCITGAGRESDSDAENWNGKWPYDTKRWKDWLQSADLARASGAPLPALPLEPDSD